VECTGAATVVFDAISRNAPSGIVCLAFDRQPDDVKVIIDFTL
jgi:hypothetical protein